MIEERKSTTVFSLIRSRLISMKREKALHFGELDNGLQVAVTLGIISVNALMGAGRLEVV